VGQLGIGDQNSVRKPKQLPSTICDGQPIQQIACGNLHTSFLTVNGEIWVCGNSTLYRGWTYVHSDFFLVPTKADICDIRWIHTSAHTNVAITSMIQSLDNSSY
jgi:alpha-tubulin suppressor-like RCC1 family protein